MLRRGGASIALYVSALYVCALCMYRTRRHYANALPCDGPLLDAPVLDSRL